MSGELELLRRFVKHLMVVKFGEKNVASAIENDMGKALLTRAI